MMQSKTTYIADDGSEFDTPEECLQYEIITKDMPGMLCFDGDATYLDHRICGVANAFESSRYIFITDASDAWRTSEYMSEQCGLVSIPYDVKTGDVYEYDGNLDEWLNIGAACEKQMACVSRLFGNMLRSCPKEDLDAFKAARDRFIRALEAFCAATRIEKEDYDA